ncbi:hypothetical protein A2U01_0085552 [Trifolium medium]|uniref:Uncharacterized protein n=1 Tax=Trifolium medium TaxID=97028 RepID=A0A392TUB2_9FABA|nr:hypothetical protein [Trifolium medium]
MVLTACATRGPLLRGAQVAEAPQLSFPFAGATRHPCQRDAQMTEETPNLYHIMAQRADSPCATRWWQKPVQQCKN